MIREKLLYYTQKKKKKLKRLMSFICCYKYLWQFLGSTSEINKEHFFSLTQCEIFTLCQKNLYLYNIHCLSWPQKSPFKIKKILY